MSHSRKLAAVTFAAITLFAVLAWPASAQDQKNCPACESSIAQIEARLKRLEAIGQPAAPESTFKASAVQPIAKAADEDARIKRIAKRAMKFFLKVELQKERSRIFRKDENKIFSLKVLLEDDEEIDAYIDEHFQEIKGSVSKSLGGASTREFGDGQIFEKLIDWLGSDGFKNFVDVLIPLIEKIVQIIGGLATVTIDTGTGDISVEFDRMRFSNQAILIRFV